MGFFYFHKRGCEAEMSKREELQTVGQIEQEEMNLQEIEERIDISSAKARELRNLAYALQAGEPNPENPARIADLQRQALYYDSLIEKATYTERHNQLYKLSIMKENAVRLRNTISHNEMILTRSRQEVEETKIRTATMIEDAEQKVIDVEYLIDGQKKELIVLEGAAKN
jgi:hypothetical protein